MTHHMFYGWFVAEVARGDKYRGEDPVYYGSFPL